EREYLANMPRAWTWGELAEPVRISSTVRGDGAYAVSTRLYRADRYGTRLEQIPLDMSLTGTITYNEDTNPKHSLSLEVNQPGRLRPFVDYLIPEVTLIDARGNRQTAPLGLYIVTPPKTTLSTGRFTGTVEGKSIVWHLAKDSLSDGLVIDPGTDYGAAARDLIRGAGFTDAQVSVPDTGYTSDSELTFDPGTTRLEAINALLDASNFYTVWADGHGVIRTSPRQDYDTARATHTYGPEHELKLLGNVDETPDWGRLRNRVTVRNITPGLDPIYVTVVVVNKDSALHADNLGFVLADPPVDDPQVTTEEQARARAEALLSSGASYYRKAKVRTVLDVTAGAHDLVELDLEHAGARYDGLWIRRTWAIKLGQVTAYTDSELYRVERWRA